MAPYATVHAFLNNTRELHMSLNASSRRFTAAELEELRATRFCFSDDFNVLLFLLLLIIYHIMSYVFDVGQFGIPQECRLSLCL